MNVNGKPQRSIWKHPTQIGVMQIIDQRALPHRFIVEDLTTLTDAVTAIRDMHVRGAPLIGVTAAYGLYLAAHELGTRVSVGALESAARELAATRPTAVNLSWAITEQLKIVKTVDSSELEQALLKRADEIFELELDCSKRIGEHGLELLVRSAVKSKPVRILTHCNAGWLACVDYGTATAPMYAAHAAGIPLHIWVDETRPRNQGASLTAWELSQHGVPHSVIADNTGGLLMQRGEVDLVIVGADRVTRNGDTANKIGTYLKALAAKDNNVPFYVALPSSTFDWELSDGVKQIPIEERSPDEVTMIEGWDGSKAVKIRLTPETSPAVNYGFDVTPARLITGFITERGICDSTEQSIRQLFADAHGG